MPWVLRLVHDLGIDPARVIPIGRSGSACWYQTPTAVELLNFRDAQQIRIETRLQATKRHVVKQIAWTPFERAVVADVADRLDLSRFHTLHPSRMFSELQPFFESKRGLGWAMDRLMYPPWPVPPLPAGVTLPETFAAVHFYARPTWPRCAQTTQFAVETIKRIASLMPVVLLGNGLHLDDHLDTEIPNLPNVLRLHELVPYTDKTVLEAQTAVLARSEAFVGTYGGFSHLALLLRKPSISLYMEWHSVTLAHRQLMEGLGLQMKVPCSVLRLGDLQPLQECLPLIQIHDQPLANGPGMV